MVSDRSSFFNAIYHFVIVSDFCFLLFVLLPFFFSLWLMFVPGSGGPLFVCVFPVGCYLSNLCVSAICVFLCGGYSGFQEMISVMSIRRSRLLSFVSHGILPSRDGIVMLMCAFSGDHTFVDRDCDGVTFVMFSLVWMLEMLLSLLALPYLAALMWCLSSVKILLALVAMMLFLIAMV